MKIKGIDVQVNTQRKEHPDLRDMPERDLNKLLMRAYEQFAGLDLTDKPTSATIIVVFET
jgi:hypothetical protein